ncbi:MAG: outer membrane protein assembly factor BamD [Bdellovibrionota bacterium]
MVEYCERAMRKRHRLAVLFIASLVLTSAAATAGCSSSEGSKKTNYISPYDHQFDPEKEEQAKADVDLPEDQLLERAKSAYDHGLYSVARENWQNLREQYPSSYYATLAELKIGDTFFFGGDYAAAITAYEDFIKLHPAHDATPYVRYQIGNSFRQQYSGTSHDQAPLVSAIKSYQKLLDEYPRSEYTVDARRAIDSCREQLGEHELTIAHFYLKQGLDRASEGRLRSLIENYGDTAAARHARTELEELDPGSAKKSAAAAAPADKSVAPRTPLVIASTAATPAADTEARFRMLEQLDNADDNQLTPTAKNPVREMDLDEAKSPLLWVNCEQSNNFLIYTAALNQALVEKQMDVGAADQANFLLAPKAFSAPQGEMAKGPAIPQHCAVESKDLRFFTAKGQSADAVLIAELKGIPAERIHAFILDRPMRFVMVVENK